MPREARHAADDTPKPVDALITNVAAERFVAAVAGQRDRDMLARQLRHQMGRQLRGIRERLVIHGRQRRHEIERILGRQHQLGVVGAEMLRDRARIVGLVEGLLVETRW